MEREFVMTSAIFSSYTESLGMPFAFDATVLSKFFDNIQRVMKVFSRGEYPEKLTVEM